MPGKTDGLRFTIQFNRNDPRHIQAAGILNLKGQRSKAAYLVEAILRYEKSGPTPELPGIELTALIESVVRRILEQEGGQAYPISAQHSSEQTPITNGGVSNNSASIEKAMQELGEDGIKSIANTLAFLRRKPN